MTEHSVQHDDDDQHRGLDRWDVIRMGLVALVAALTWFHVWQPVSRFDVLAMAGLLVGGWPIWREALQALLERRMTMELSMTIAIGAAAVIGEFFTALVIVLFVLVAEVLEGLTVARGRKAIKQLVDLLPRVALVRRGGAEHEVSADELQVGEIILVKPGARIPIDGIVAGGHSFVDQATITGESMPVEKLAGEQVFAGTINQSGAMEIRTTGIGRDTAFGHIIEAVERAEQSRAPIEKTADRLAGYLVYFALACAGFTFLVTRDVRATISVIIVAGACGIAAGTPLAILGGIGCAARIGSIIKGGVYLEALGRVRTVVLDKTGTLTLGKPEVAQVLPVPGTTVLEVLETAAIAEKRSEHPLATAISGAPPQRCSQPANRKRSTTSPGSASSRRTAERRSWWETVPYLPSRAWTLPSWRSRQRARQKCWWRGQGGRLGQSVYATCSVPKPGTPFGSCASSACERCCSRATRFWWRRLSATSFRWTRCAPS